MNHLKQEIDFEGFKLFMETFLESELAEEFCQHLFLSFCNNKDPKPSPSMTDKQRIMGNLNLPIGTGWTTFIQTFCEKQIYCNIYFSLEKTFVKSVYTTTKKFFLKNIILLFRKDA